MWKQVHKHRITVHIGQSSVAKTVWPPWVQVESRELPAASLLGVWCLYTADGLEMPWTWHGLGVGSRSLLSDQELLIRGGC